MKPNKIQNIFYLSQHNCTKKRNQSIDEDFTYTNLTNEVLR